MKMNKDKAIKVLDMFLYKQCDLERTSSSYDSNTVWSAICFARDQLEAQIPKRGVWIIIGISVNGSSTAKCSECGAIVHDSFTKTPNYCPNCGANMIEEKIND